VVRRRTVVVVGAAVVFAVLLSLGAETLLTGSSHRSGSDTTVLIQGPSYAWLPGGQFNGVSFVSQGEVRVAGSFTGTSGLIVYLMTPPDFLALVKTGVVGGFNWTSGSIPSPLRYALSLNITAGAWVLVFLNPSQIIPSGVDYWTSVTEQPI
jgi:hypothetical protein